MHEPWVLSLDVGTSSVRAVGYSVSGNPLPNLHFSIPHSPSTTVDGGSEFHAEKLFSRCLQVLRGALQRKGDRTSPTAVACSTFWHSLVGITQEGIALTPVYTWADTRSSDFVDEFRHLLNTENYHNQTGCFPHTSYLPARLLWLLDAKPAITQHVDYWVSFADYFYFRLFNILATSFAMASGSGLFSPHTLSWIPEVCKVIGISPANLPHLVDVDYRYIGLGKPYDQLLPELADIPWFTAIGDGACSNLGTGCATSNRIAVMVGTSGAMRLIKHGTSVVPPEGLWCYRLDKRRYVLGGALSNGGNVFTWMSETLQLPSPERLEQALVRMAPDSHDLTILPLLAGERSPGWAAHATGAIMGLRLHTTAIDIVHATLEAICIRFAAIYSELRPLLDSTGTVVATGGALLLSAAWMQMMADVLGIPLIASTETEASCRGASLLALEQLGLIADATFVPAGLGTVYQPRLEFTHRYHAVMERQQQLYQTLYPST